MRARTTPATLARICGLAAALSLVAGAATPAVADVSEGDKAKLEAGEIIVRTHAVAGSDMPRAVVTAVIEAPITRAWAIIDKCADYKRTMSRVLESKELSRQGGVVMCKIKVDIPWPFDDLEATTRATHTIDPGKRYRRAWTLVEGNYTRNEGSWTLTNWAGSADRTLAVYEVHAEPKTSIPVAIRKKVSKSALPDLMDNLRKFSGAKVK